MDYQALEEHIKDSVMEEQAKLGFRKEVIRLYYPVGMLNNLFGTACDAEEMQQALAGFTDFAKERLGEVTITHKKDRFCLLLPEETSIYVHEHKKENERSKPFCMALSSSALVIPSLEPIPHGS